MKPHFANILPSERALEVALLTFYPCLVFMLLRARLQQRRDQRKAVGGAAQTTLRSLRVATRSSFAFFLCSSTVVMAPLVLLARPSTTAAIRAEAKPAIVHGPGASQRCCPQAEQRLLLVGRREGVLWQSAL